MNWFDFTEVPPVGLRVRYTKSFVTLVDVKPHVRKDGTETHVLTWRSDSGRVGTSGLRGHSITWVPQ